MAVPRLKEKYRTEIVPAMLDQFGYKNVMQVPKVMKLTLNMGVGEGTHDAKAMEEASLQLGQITGQKPQVRRARKSVANFKLRTGMPVGLRVTLRGDRMYEMLDRLVSVALPRIRDFRGIGVESFDGHGNYNLGVKEQIIFPEIDYDKIDRIRGLDVSITTTAKTDDEGRALLTMMGMPFRES
jgi:large subunit ribosomal protein L5